MDQFRAQTVSLCWLGFVRHNLVGQFSKMAESLVRTEACYDLVGERASTLKLGPLVATLCDIAKGYCDEHHNVAALGFGS